MLFKSILSVAALLNGVLAAPSLFGPSPVNQISGGPLGLCSESGNQFDVTEIKLNPYPIVHGQELSVDTIGVSKVIVTQGAKMKIKVKKGPIKLYESVRDLCEQAKADGKECPVQAGPQTLSVREGIPGIAPAGKYGLTVEVINGDNSPILCLTGTIQIV